MAMDKYGVSDLVDQQKAELAVVRRRIKELRESSEKTASEHDQLEFFEQREADLKAQLAEH